MKWRARFLLAIAMLATPAYWLLDRQRLVAAAIRDRPWPFALVAVVLALVAVRLARSTWWLALLVTIITPLTLGWAAYVRYRLPIASSTFGVGKPLPDLRVPNQDGTPLALRSLAGKPMVLIWFRGSWCPYCRRQLTELEAELPLYAGDVQLIAVAPEPPEPLAKLRRDMHLSFDLLADPEQHLVGVCELGHCVAIVDATGVVRWGVLSGNWERDLPARALLQAAYRSRN